MNIFSHATADKPGSIGSAQGDIHAHQILISGHLRVAGQAARNERHAADAASGTGSTKPGPLRFPGRGAARCRFSNADAPLAFDDRRITQTDQETTMST